MPNPMSLETLNRLLSEEAQAAGQTLSEYMDALMGLARSSDPDRSEFKTEDAFREWLLTDKGQEALPTILKLTSSIGALHRFALKEANKQGIDKNEIGLLYKLLNGLQGLSREEVAEQALGVQRMLSIARKTDAEPFEQNAQSLMTQALDDFKARAAAAKTIEDLKALFDPAWMESMFTKHFGMEDLADTKDAGSSDSPQEKDPELARQIAEDAARTMPTEPPAWLADIQPINPPTDGTNGVHRVIGAWPGEETDEEIQKALARLS